MTLRTTFGAFLAVCALFLALTSWSAVPKSTAAPLPINTCTFTNAGTTMTLDADCTTDSSILIPEGFTLDGASHSITGVDPVGGHFVGGVVQSAGTEAHVTNLQVSVSGLANTCDGGPARLRGILFDGASGSITNNVVTGINQGPSGCQEGNGIEVRNFGSFAGTIRVTIDGNTISDYQKTGIIVNGDTEGTITDNTVNGGGPVGYIARNGIQIGFGAKAMVKRNTVSGNSYTGSSAVSGGILVVGGPFYDPAFTAFSTGDQIMQNTLSNNDVGVYISQYNADLSAPATATNIKVVGNTISNSAKTNGFVYQAGVSDVGNNDKIINNTISGNGYNPADSCGCLFRVDADVSFTNRAKVHANK